MLPLDSFDQISVISDLHIGGEQGFQIFREGPLLTAFINDLREKGTGECALVINGDTVDFLAEKPAKYFDPGGANAKLDRIFGDPNFAPVWSALRKFVKTPHRRLVLVLGNHDIELALPWVREHLLDLLSEGDAKARSRITLSFDGSGYVCRVADANILCLHGNEVDTWNVTDYEAMRRIACDFVQRRPSEEWIPNAGTKLVIEVMNDVKRELAFVDLLKPETEGAVRILLVLKPELRNRLKDVANVAARRVWDSAKRAIGLLSGEEDEQLQPDSEAALARVIGPQFEVTVDTARLLDRSEKQLDEDPLDLVYEQQSQQLGVWSALVSVVRQREPHQVAWSAVKELADDPSFEVRRSDETFRMIDEYAGENFDYVIVGHTHLARSLGRARGRGHYYNTGTWASLMRLKKAQLASAKAFKPVFEAMKRAKTIDGLDQFVLRRPTVVTIRAQNGRAKAALQKVTATKQGKIVLDDSV
jgi:UDP-2,3-diacylglucosamine pyrophosphatase LpxH